MNKEYFNTVLQNHRLINQSNAPTTFDFTRKVEHSIYTPLYTLGLRPTDSIPSGKLLVGSFSPDAFDILYSTDRWKDNPLFVKFIEVCLEKEMYNLILLCPFSSNHTDILKIKARILNNANAFIYNTWVNTHFRKTPHESTVNTIQDMFNCVKMCNTFTVHRMKSTTALAGIKYLTNLMFLGEYGSSNSDITPLVIGMVDKDNMQDVRRCFANNVPIPTSLIELWIDESVEAIGSKLKPLFRKHIKFKAEEVGIPLKYFSDLRAEVMVPITTDMDTTEDIRAQQSRLLNKFYDVANGLEDLYKPGLYSVEAVTQHTEILSREIDEVLAIVQSTI